MNVIESVDKKIKDLEEKLALAHEKVNNQTRVVSNSIKLLISEEFSFPVNLVEVSFSEYSTRIEVNHEDDDWSASEITIYHNQSRNKSEFSFGYSMTTVHESSIQYLFYLELLGKISKDFRTDKKLINEINNGLDIINSSSHNVMDIETELRLVTYDKQRFIEDEVLKEVMSNNGLKLMASVREFIRDSDSRPSYVKEIKIVKANTNTITIQYLDGDGDELDTYRQSLIDAKKTIFKYHQKLKTQIEVGEERLAKR